LVGEVTAPGRVVPGGPLVVLAVQRYGRNRGRTPLQAGDLLLLEGPWSALDDLIDHDDVLLVDSPPLVRRQSVPLGQRSTRAIAVLAAMVVLLATGIVPPVVAALLAAGAMVVLRVLTVQQAYRRISWTTVLLVAGIIPLSTAIRTSGAGELVAEVIVGAVRDAGPLLLVALFALTVASDRGSEHGDRLDRDPHRGFGGRSARRFAPAGVHDGLRRRRRIVPDAGRDAREHDGDGPGRLPLRGLLEARVAADRCVLRGRDRTGAVGVAPVRWQL